MNFAALSKLMYDEDGMIKAVELAPNGVVRSVYPQASNADALELNMLRHPERKVEASLAKESGQYTIAELEKAARGGRRPSLRALPDARSTVPIIAMTANAFEEDKQRAFDAGMNDHISKPINVNALLAALRKNLK